MRRLRPRRRTPCRPPFRRAVTCATYQIRASKLIGSAVYDPTDQKIGTIDELVLNADGKVADVVLGVGGFLGAGEKRVAVPMADLKRGKNDHFVLAATKDSLKQMANFEFKTASTAGSGSSAHK